MSSVTANCTQHRDANGARVTDPAPPRTGERHPACPHKTGVCAGVQVQVMRPGETSTLVTKSWPRKPSGGGWDRNRKRSMGIPADATCSTMCMTYAQVMLDDGD